MKKILIINGHPDIKSLSTELAHSYEKGALASGAECKLIHLCEINFDLVLHHGYHHRTHLENELIQVQQDIKHADHIVFVYPTWWGTYPALLKGLIDRIFLPGFAFQYRENSWKWDKLLTGKTARLIVTMDTPLWYYYFCFGKPGHKSMKKNILEFCGIKPVKISSFGPVKSAGEIKIKQWFRKVEDLGRRMI
ncbi:MAG: NAD(P)H-dependent oxidoreductase [Paludibacter sp.]|nr:NAD(P)H-dependent oxidoreductase [Paludibacter sp.]